MRKARVFCYVSLGILALVVAFELGASSVDAQQPAGIEGAALNWFGYGSDTFGYASGVVDRYFCLLFKNGTAACATVPIPGTARIVATDPSARMVMLENGEVYGLENSEWVLKGNVLGAMPVGTTSTTWGRMKAERREERGLGPMRL